MTCRFAAGKKMQKLNLKMQKLNFPGTHWRGLALIGAQKNPDHVQTSVHLAKCFMLDYQKAQGEHQLTVHAKLTVHATLLEF